MRVQARSPAGDPARTGYAKPASNAGRSRAPVEPAGRSKPGGSGAPSGGRRRGRRLRSYLLWLLLLFVVAAAAGIWSVWLEAERDTLRAARDDARSSAAKAAGLISDSLASVRASVGAVASAPGVKSVFTEPSNCRLAFELGGATGRGHLDVLARDGTVVCSSLPPASVGNAGNGSPAGNGGNGGPANAYRHTSWLAEAVRAPRTAAPVVDERTGARVALLSTPVPGYGVVVAFVDLAALGDDTGNLFGGARGLEFVLLSADRGTILTRWPDGAGWIGRSVRGSRLTAPGGDGSGTDVTGRRRVYGQADIAAAGWHLTAGADRASAVGAARRLAARQALVTGLGLLAGLLATMLVQRRITGPIGHLRTAVNAAIAAGQPEAWRTVEVTGPREITDLATDFNTLLATMGRELADRRRAEQTARDHERNYRQMFEASPSPVLLYDATTAAVLAANDAAVRYYGHDRDTLLSMRVTDLIADTGTDGGESGGRAAQPLPPVPVENGGSAAAVGPADDARRRRRQRHVKADGTITEVSVTCYATSFGGRDARCAVVDDVTEREHLERRLRQSERLESLGHLAAGIAHDFNNLLGIINGYAGMAAADVEPAAAADPTLRQVHADMVEIVAAGDRATALTRQLLAFAREDAAPESRVLDLNRVVRDVEKLLRRTIGEDIALRINLSAEPYPVYADPGRLEQVLLNLAVNARDAMPTGGVLSIETDALAVDEYFAAHHPGVRPGSYLRLRVSDTGVGMRKETVDRAFEPFFTTKPKGQGTGLGLATIYGIITQAGGHAELYSEPGAGTTFSALLPITDAAASSGAPAAVPPGRGAGQRILLVEDNDSLRELTERILQRAGYTVLAAANGADAQRLADAPPGLDLLLTDVVLPDLHGPAVYELIRTAHPDVRVVFMSGYAETILAERSTVPVGATVLNKPVSGHQLLSTVERALAAERRAGQDAS